jgi:hypothetical protein
VDPRDKAIQILQERLQAMERRNAEVDGEVDWEQRK